VGVELEEEFTGGGSGTFKVDFCLSYNFTITEAPCILASTPHPSVIPILKGLLQHLKQFMITILGSHYKRQAKANFCVRYRYRTV
jgi:hypothetical protein